MRRVENLICTSLNSKRVYLKKYNGLRLIWKLYKFDVLEKELKNLGKLG